MLDTDTKRRIDTARDILVGKVPDPKSQVEQITIALIYKFMDDMDAESEEFGGERKFFANEFARYGWAKLMRSGLGGHEVLNLYAEAITKMPENPGIPSLFRDIFKNAYLPYRDPETLRAFLKIIDEFSYDHSERLGDAFEYLLSVLGSQGDAGQFRTPRHIIDFMVQILDPKKTETILDPACGTAGFLISSYKHILRANIDEKGNITLTPDDRGRLAQNFRGYDISPDMVRLSLVNMYLHGFADPHIFEYDTLTSQERWNEYADVILANPPFMSPKGGIKPHNRFSVQSKRSEVLFVDYMAEHLTPTGRAGIIVPEGIIFQSQNAYKQLRKMLVENSLVAIISLPAGVFQPYSGVKTSILILDKSLVRKSKTIAFFKVENDGFGLGAQRREIDKNDLPQVQTEIGEYLRRLRAGESVEDFTPTLGLVVPKEKIAANGDYNLSGERYREGVERETTYPKVPLGNLLKLEFGTRITKKDDEGTLFPVYGGGGASFLTNSFTRENDVVISRFAMSPTCVRVVSGKFYLLDSGFTFSIAASFADRAIKPFVNQVLLNNQDRIYACARGHAQKNIDVDEFKSLQIPLPPLDVQKEIVAEIEGYQKVIDGARAVIENYKPTINRNARPIDVKLKVLEALRKFRQKDMHLIAIDSNERSMTAKISSYLQEQFPAWDVDHEYNRDGEDPKRVNDSDKCIIPDIIVHKRGVSQNYIILEVKKQQRSEEDKEKLSKAVEKYGYQYAFIVNIDPDQNLGNWLEVVAEPKCPIVDEIGEWPMVKLQDACDLIMDGTHFSPNNSSKGTRLYVTSKNVRENYLDMTHVSFVSEEDHRAIYSRCPVKKGDVLFVKDGANAGLAAINHIGEEFSLLSSVAVIRPNPQHLDNRYLVHYLNSAEGRNRMLSLVSGVAITRLTLIKIKEADFPLPPLSIQQAIVNEIEAEQALVNTNRELISRMEKKIQDVISRVWGE